MDKGKQLCKQKPIAKNECFLVYFWWWVRLLDCISTENVRNVVVS